MLLHSRQDSARGLVTTEGVFHCFSFSEAPWSPRSGQASSYSKTLREKTL